MISKIFISFDLVIPFPGISSKEGNENVNFTQNIFIGMLFIIKYDVCAH